MYSHRLTTLNAYNLAFSNRRPCNRLIASARKDPNSSPPVFTESLNPSLTLAPLVQDKKFQCTECGKCCTGAGEVWCNDNEMVAIARFLGLSEKHFINKYIKNYSRRPGWHLIRRVSGTGDCVFLKNKLCTIYGARPVQCATYPFWPELMGDHSWKAEGENVCEGINHENAPKVDPVDAAAKLARSSEYTADFDAAGMLRSALRKRK